MAVHVFRGEYGRLCSLAAHAIRRSNVSRDAVRLAFQGLGVDHRCRVIRAQRRVVNAQLLNANDALISAGITGRTAAHLLIVVAREARDAVEQEWCISLPIVDPNP